MNRQLITIVFVCYFALSSGCAKKNAPLRQAVISAFAGRPPDRQRYIAVRHKFEIVVRESQLQKSWESVINFCSTIHCEILNSSITARTRESWPSAAITLRVAPEDTQKLMDQLEKQDSIVQHTTKT